MKKNLSAMFFMTFFACAVSAQDFSMPPPIDFSAGMPTQLWTTVEEERSGIQNPYIHGRAQPNNSEAPSLTYTPSTSRTRANLASFVAKTRSANPASADQLEQLFASTDIINQIGGMMTNFGLDKNNAADAFALYWISAWQAANGDTSVPSTEMSRAVAAQAAFGLSQSPQFAKATNAQKQEMAEDLLLRAALIEAATGEAANDPAKMNALNTAVVQGALTVGLELDKMELTEQGFREATGRKRSDASDAVPGEERALAANDAGGDSGDSARPNYALIAGAAGAGLGLAFLLGKAMGKKG